MDLPQPGRILGAKYRLVRPLGRGGMGSVWLAQHLGLNAPVALKFIANDDFDEAALQRFLAEARIAAALRSPHVVQILDYGVEAGTPHIAMELLEGETLAERLARVGRLVPEQARRMLQHVARAVARAHDAEIVHRDLKPENIFIVHYDDEEVFKVLDFGIAKGSAVTLGMSAGAATRTGAFLGTPHYMSPEQVEEARSIDHRTDIWSLGVLAFRCLLGQLPFQGDSIGRVLLAICSRPLPVPSQIGPVPAGFDLWFARACARDPAQRFSSVRQAASEFLALGAEPGALGACPSSGHILEPAQGPLHAEPFPSTVGELASAEIASAATGQGRFRQLGALAFALAVLVLGVLSWYLSPGRSRSMLAPPSAAAAPSEFGPVKQPAPELTPPPAQAAPTEMPSEPAPGGAAPAALAPAPQVRAPAATSQRKNATISTRRLDARSSRGRRAPFERIPDVPPTDLDLGI
jgi:eukaryotic-like serine/threonine-protein kinase